VYDVVVVGGGIVGLATAYRLLQKHPGSSVLVLEKEKTVASHQTGHNSGVIHAGIYYKPGSLKARIAVRGALALVRFCEEHDVPFELSGKVIVASGEEERPRLDALLERGRANGVPDLRAISREELEELEPHAAGIAGIHSPRTGIVSFRAVAEAIAAEIGRLGGSVRTGAELLDARREDGSLRLHTRAGEVVAKLLVTAAGLQADRVAVASGSEPSVTILPFRGEYYRLKPASRRLVRSLIYPVPDPRFPFLGVHFTRRVDGEIEAGPNAVLALAREGYRKTDFDARDLWQMVRYPGTVRMARRYWKTGLAEYYRSLSKSAFVRSLQKLVPEIAEDDLERGGAGVRAMALERDGSLVDDFRIVREERVIHVLNAPSPAATSALAIGDYVANLSGDC
jgi:(S)-2-hydroxyglutarate dehydrogenase